VTDVCEKLFHPRISHQVRPAAVRGGGHHSASRCHQKGSHSRQTNQLKSWSPLTLLTISNLETLY